MKLPKLNEPLASKETVEEFSGYCKRIRNGAGEFNDMKNMTCDYYPAASPRDKRSLQLENGANDIVISYEENGETINQTLYAYSSECAQFSGNDLYILKKVKNGENADIGCCFIKNGADVSLNESDAQKLEYIDSSSKTELIRMGSYLCAFPDGVILESENSDESLPLFKVEAEKTLDNFLISTVYKNSLDEYTDILEYSGSFRIDENSVGEYLSEQALWVNKTTYIKISALSEDKAFDLFNVNDSVSINTLGPPGLHGDISGSIIIKQDDAYENSASYKIIDKGSESVNSYDRDYIIINGYINFETSSKAYFNASDFEIRQNLFAKYQSEEGAEITLKRKMPKILFSCEAQNRIWACSEDGREIYASSLGNPYNFYDFSGISTDSFAVNVGTNGEFTACVNYLGHPLFFKENSLHMITGSYPSNAGELDGMSFSVSTTTDFKGVEKGSEKSIAIIDNILYYKSSSGIVAFDGANTSLISYSLGKERYKNAVAGAYNNKYYVSMQDSKGAYHLFVYDTELGTWCREDGTRVLQFFTVNNELLFLRDDNKIFSVSDGDVLENDDYEKEGDFDWMCETGNYGYSYPNNKYLSRFQLRLQIYEGASASFYIQYNSDGIWHRKGEMTGKGTKTHLIPIVPVRCDHMKIKIEGRGDVKILSVSKILEEGGDA